MKTLSLKIDKEKLELNPAESEKNPVELAVTIIKNVILACAMQDNKRGLSEDDRRKFYKISDVLDNAVKENLEAVELEDDWMGFIKKSFRDAKLLPDKLLRQVEILVLGEDGR